MADICPGCRRDLDPFVAHMCGVMEWSPRLTSTETPLPTAAASSCSSGSCCGACGSPAPTTETTAPSIEDVLIRTLDVHPDSRGNVRETYRASWFPRVPTIRQLVRSESEPATLRGMHLHRKQWDVWTFVAGSALVRLRYPDGTEKFIYSVGYNTIAIPPGVSHGFYTFGGCTLLYALTEEYDGTDEYGWYPFDGLNEDSHPGWPRDHIGLVISERDLRAPRLVDFAP